MTSPASSNLHRRIRQLSSFLQAEALAAKSQLTKKEAKRLAEAVEKSASVKWKAIKTIES